MEEIECTSNDVHQCNRELLQALRADGYTILNADLTTTADGCDSEGPKTYMYVAYILAKRGSGYMYGEYVREERFQNTPDDRIWDLSVCETRHNWIDARLMFGDHREMNHTGVDMLDTEAT